MMLDEHDLDGVAADLDWLDLEPVFVGGSVIGLYLDAFGREHARATEDVDCIVPGIRSAVGVGRFEEQLRRRRWTPDSTGPICRYRSPRGTPVDLMAEDPTVLGFAGRWYPEGVAHAERRRLSTGRDIRVLTIEYLLACKLEAFGDRGRDDPLVSEDLEDIVALLDGCKDAEPRVAAAPAHLQRWISSRFDEIATNARLIEAATGQLPRGGDLRTRESNLRAALARLARLATD